MNPYRTIVNGVSPLLIYLIIFSNSYPQIPPKDDLFNFNYYSSDRYIRISDRIKNEAGLSSNIIRNSYYNSNKDQNWLSSELPRFVSTYYIRADYSGSMEMSLYDDGFHFDNENDDGIYSNYIETSMNEFLTQEYEVDVCCMDSVGINYRFLTLPTTKIPASPYVLYPKNGSKIVTPIIHWSVDAMAIASHIVLLDKPPELGRKFEGILWEGVHFNDSSSINIDNIPLELEHNKEYYVIFWSYAGKEGNNGYSTAFSLEWSSFIIDASLSSSRSLNILQNFPNPFSTETTIVWTQPRPDHIAVIIYDILGREVKILENDFIQSDYNIRKWDGTDDIGKKVSSGIYFLRISSLNENRMIKIAYIK